MELQSKIRNTHFIQLAFLSLVILALYWQVTGFDFVLDDKMVITENKYVLKGLSGLKEIFTKDSMSGYLGDNPNLLTGGRYRPLSLAIFAAGYQFFGLNRFFFHLMNIIAYLITCLLAWKLLHNLFKEKYSGSQFAWVLFVATLLFAVQPVHTEVVANIKGLDEILSCLFAFAGFLAFLDYPVSRDKKLLIPGLLSLFLSFLAKESSLPFVVLIPLGLIYFRRIPVHKAFRIFLLLLIPAAAYFLMRYQALGYLLTGKVHETGIMNSPFIEASFSQKYGTIALIILLYLKLLFFPHPLTHDYYPWQVPLTPIYHPLALLAFIVVILLIVISIRQYYRKTLLSFVILYFFLTISIVSNILINVGTLMNERFLFIPSLALSLLVFSLFDLLKVKKIVLFYALAGIFVAGFTFKTLTRLPDWKTMKSLDSADVRVSKNSARQNLFYAVDLFQEIQAGKDPETKSKLIREGIPYINRSLQIYPDYADALNMKAGFAVEKFNLDNNLQVLLDTFLTVIRIRDVKYADEYAVWLSRRYDKKMMSEYFFKAGYTVYTVQKKDFQKGLDYLMYGYNLDPTHRGILFGLCVVNYLSVKFANSANYGNQYLQQAGENADILYYTGKSLFNTGQQEKGLALVEKAFQMKPELKKLK